MATMPCRLLLIMVALSLVAIVPASARDLLQAPVFPGLTVALGGTPRLDGGPTTVGDYNTVLITLSYSNRAPLDNFAVDFKIVGNVFAYQFGAERFYDPSLSFKLISPVEFVISHPSVVNNGNYAFTVEFISAQVTGSDFNLNTLVVTDSSGHSYGNFSLAAVLPKGFPTPTPPSNQGVCGSGAAANFPVRCFYNNDPQGRYVCCDSAGCDGFLPPDNSFPHCKANGYVPTLTVGAQPSPTTAATVPAPTQASTVPAATTASSLQFPKDQPCPLVGAQYSNSCFNRAGTFHVCCQSPDSCGAFAANGDPTCAAGKYVTRA